MSVVYEWRLFKFFTFNYTSSLHFKPNDKQKRTTLRKV